MLLNEILDKPSQSEDKYSAALKKFLEKSGRKVAHGTHAFALLSDDKKFVWRVWVLDRGYEKFLEYVKQHSSNENLPKFFGGVRTHLVNFPNDQQMKFKFIRTEKLSEMQPSVLMDAINTVDSYIFDNSKENHPKTFDALVELIPSMKIVADSDATHDEIIQTVKQHKPLFETILDLLALGADDINGGNVMMRGTVPVIIDPFYS